MARFAVALTLVLSALPALAHPGHGKDGGSHAVSHYATEPTHVAPLAAGAAVAALLAAGYAWSRRKA